MSKPSGYTYTDEPLGALSGPSTVEVPSGSQILNHEKLETRPGLLRTATIRPPSDCAMSSQFSVSPSPLTTGAARRVFCAPSSDASQASPLSTYATDAASATAGVARTAASAVSSAARAASVVAVLAVPASGPWRMSESFRWPVPGAPAAVPPYRCHRALLPLSAPHAGAAPTPCI